MFSHGIQLIRPMNCGRPTYDPGIQRVSELVIADSLHRFEIATAKISRHVTQPALSASSFSGLKVAIVEMPESEFEIVIVGAGMTSG